MALKLLPPKYENSWETYAVLLFLGIYLYRFVGADAVAIGVGAACLLLFLPLYFWGHWLSAERVMAPVLAITLLGLIALPFNAGASVFISYAASLACLAMPLWRALAVCALVLAVFAAGALLCGFPLLYIAGNSFIVVVVTAIYVQVRRSELIHERLGRRDQEIEAIARLAERRRIADDLHDAFGQSFALIAVKAELCRRLLPGPPGQADRQLEELAAIARSTLTQARDTVHGYQDCGLDDQLDAATTLLEGAGVDTQVRRGVERMPPLIEGLMALILRESVTNIVRHARARRCEIELSSTSGAIVLEVRDDGTGSRAYEGSGVRGMVERAQRLGGQLSIRRRAGTVVRLSVPAAEIA